jgi:hypothetical protein
MTTPIYITTPCLNVIETMDRTILSVVAQAGDFFIRYHVQDGGSTDGTLERLAWWQKQLESGRFPIHCKGIRFTYASEPDTGMYDALCKGFEAMPILPHSFMAWINGDDILEQGALALVANVTRHFYAQQVPWLAGATSLLRGDVPLVTHDVPMPTAALQAGLCDGMHWSFIQQEGIFFRKWLWDSVDVDRTVRPMKLAGDWNLWRLFAQKASLVQTTFTLGRFRIRAEQLSARLRDKYMAEINDRVPEAERRARFEALDDGGPVTRRALKTRYADDRIWVVEESASGQFTYHYSNAFGRPPKKNHAWTAPVDLFEGTLIGGPKVSAVPDMTPVKKEKGLLAFDRHWQFPAITEQHAFHCIRDRGVASEGVTYIAYPWATLIDKIQSTAPDLDDHLTQFWRFCHDIPKETVKVTVCQHIHARQYLSLFREAGIRDVFWTHATRADQEETATGAGEGAASIRFHPFPLYPVQVPQALPEAGPDHDALPRPHLFSFIGARPNHHYLTEARTWILDLLKDDPRGLIIGRDSWHYQKVVYDLQITGGAASAESTALVDTSASDEFRASLLQSTFSLCPAGSGPNSIRLWESIGAGAIPVILADTWAPPGDPRLWDMAAVFCKETPEDIRALPDRLAAIAADPERLAQMRQAMRQIWLLYGPDSFVTDVQQFMLAQGGGPGDGMPGEDTLPAALIPGGGPDLLQAAAAALLLDPAATQARIAADAALAEALRKARAALPEGAALARHYDAVCAHATRAALPDPTRTPTPALGRNAVPRLCLIGRHAIRTPLSYAPLRRLIGDRLAFVDTPDTADLLVTGFNLDLRENVATLRPLLQRPTPPKIAILSEEPLWDITWSGPFTGRDGAIQVDGLTIPYTFLGHETSDIYAFDRIPYFVLTSETYAVRYANLMARFARLGAAALLDRWARAPVSAAFCAEHRKGTSYDKAFPERGVAGLSVYRTELAEAATGQGVLRMGKGWGTDRPRQALPDWHLDKLALLDGRTRVLSALENVHQRLYISEKIFDAFAIGAIPAYWAAPGHRIFDLVPAGSMINCHALTPGAAADKIAATTPDTAMAEAWLETCARLATLFADTRAIRNEQKRVANATLKEILAIA